MKELRLMWFPLVVGIIATAMLLTAPVFGESVQWKISTSDSIVYKKEAICPICKAITYKGERLIFNKCVHYVDTDEYAIFEKTTEEILREKIEILEKENAELKEQLKHSAWITISSSTIKNDFNWTPCVDNN